MGRGLRQGLEHAIAVGYGVTYDAIVTSFPPYRALLEQVVAYAKRSVGPRADPRSAHVLDVASGIGTLTFRLAQEGYSIVGLDGVEYLVDIAREKRRARNVPNVAFHRLDIGGDDLPWRDTFDFAVSLHTLYWHPRPLQVLVATLGALKPGAHALFRSRALICWRWILPVAVRGIPSTKKSAFGTLNEASRSLQWSSSSRLSTDALRWLVPTAIFERFRDYEPHYTDADEFRALLRRAGFEILEAKQTFLADISCLAWIRRPR